MERVRARCCLAVGAIALAMSATAVGAVAAPPRDLTADLAPVAARVPTSHTSDPTRARSSPAGRSAGTCASWAGCRATTPGPVSCPCAPTPTSAPPANAKAACFNGTDTTKPCPLFTFPRTMDSNAACNLCAECVKSCPNDAITISVRKPTSELWFIRKPKVEESFLAMAIMGIVLIQNLTMLEVWNQGLGWLEDATGSPARPRSSRRPSRSRSAPRSRCWRSPPGSQAAATPSRRGRTSPASATR